MASAPVSLDPRFATDAASVRVNRLLYRALVDFDAASRPVPQLARWERLSPTRYRFLLGEEGRRFSGGGRLTAEDVAATYRSILDPATGSPLRAGLAMIRAVRALDEDTVEFELSRPDPLFPGRLGVGILPAAAVAAGRRLDRSPEGSGPFALLDWPAPGVLRLRRRADGLVVRLERVRDPTVRLLKLLRGELDLLQNDLPPELVRYAASRPELVVRRRPGSNFSYLGFNLEDPDTGRLEVRRAVAHALDREAIVRHVLAGAARPAEALLPPEHWAGARGLAPYRHDPERARALLRRAGYGPARPLRLTYKTSADPFRLRLATVIQDQLARVGVRVTIRSYDWGTFYGDVKAGRFQMYSLTWVGVRSPDLFRYIFHSASIPPRGANRGRYRSAEADRLIEAAEAALEPAEQARLFRRLQALLHEELPYVPLWYEDHVLVARRAVEGYRLRADGAWDGLATVRLRGGALAGGGRG